MVIISHPDTPDLLNSVLFGTHMSFTIYDRIPTYSSFCLVQNKWHHRDSGSNHGPCVIRKSGITGSGIYWQSKIRERLVEQKTKDKNVSYQKSSFLVNFFLVYTSPIDGTDSLPRHTLKEQILLYAQSS